MKEIYANAKGVAIALVNSTNTAITAQSGSLPVFGTPFMIALMEKATCILMAEFVEDNETTVGTKIDVIHSKASGLGTVVTATALLTKQDGKKLVFDVVAKDDKGDVIGSGTIERYVVDSIKFLKRVEEK